jgi:hypothetical protein
LSVPLLFAKVNTVLEVCERESLLDAPSLPAFGPNPVKGFEIRRENGRIVFRVKFSPEVRWEERPPLEDIMVFGWTRATRG